MDVPTIITAALQILLALVGFPAALSALLTLLGKFGLSPALASQISFYANVLAFVGIAILVATGQTALVQIIDASLVGVAKLLADIIIVLGGFGISYVRTARSLAEARRLSL